MNQAQGKKAPQFPTANPEVQLRCVPVISACGSDQSEQTLLQALLCANCQQEFAVISYSKFAAMSCLTVTGV